MEVSFLKKSAKKKLFFFSFFEEIRRNFEDLAKKNMNEFISSKKNIPQNLARFGCFFMQFSRVVTKLSALIASPFSAFKTESAM